DVRGAAVHAVVSAGAGALAGGWAKGEPIPPLRAKPLHRRRVHLVRGDAGLLRRKILKTENGVSVLLLVVVLLWGVNLFAHSTQYDRSSVIPV
ncbi:hypothetical protein, partial [Salmonella sp. s58408]|uniref:hypothetical protein n=1 Tax=Salmonella sp. s58408 TaxID=3159701 RepID=UPI003980D1F1